MIVKDEFKYGFYGNIVTDCAVRNKDLFIFSARNEEESYEHDLTGEWDVTKYGCMFQFNKPEGKRIGKLTVNGWGRLYCTACAIPLDKFVCISAEGRVYTLGSGENKEEKNISNSWINKQALPDNQGGGPGYFGVCRSNMDIDGFSENDMYAVGGQGRVWHYDGQSWRQIAFPTNMYLYTVCCGGDGEVYIGAQSGAVFKGRGDGWQKIISGEMAKPFNDMVWFQDRVWATSDYGIWVIKNDGIEKPLIPDEVMVCAGSMAVGDGVLLIAGEGGAAFHNGILWQSLFLQKEMTLAVDNS